MLSSKFNSISLNIEGTIVKALIDTGSDISLVKYSELNSNQRQRITESDLILRDVQGTTIKNIGKVKLTVKIGKTKRAIHQFIAVGNEMRFRGTLLLGLDFLHRFEVFICWSEKTVKLLNQEIQLETEEDEIRLIEKEDASKKIEASHLQVVQKEEKEKSLITNESEGQGDFPGEVEQPDEGKHPQSHTGPKAGRIDPKETSWKEVVTVMTESILRVIRTLRQGELARRIPSSARRRGIKTEKRKNNAYTMPDNPPPPPPPPGNQLRNALGLSTAATQLIPNYSGEDSVRTFLSYVEDVSELEGWNEVQKVKVARLKLQGPARRLVEWNEELKSPACTWIQLKNALIQRFEKKVMPVEQLHRFRSCTQREGESVTEFAERLQMLGAATMKKTADPNRNEWIRAQLLEECLVQFLEGLNTAIQYKVVQKEEKEKSLITNESEGQGDFPGEVEQPDEGKHPQSHTSPKAGRIDPKETFMEGNCNTEDGEHSQSHTDPTAGGIGPQNTVISSQEMNINRKEGKQCVYVEDGRKKRNEKRNGRRWYHQSG
ncbi:hypothetical protein TcasGA2_TC033284 [Tribolium castaneum]|uniref:Peptidase A2 domain-containing protein n=1 Tax=Tribolium castaneum TaxID=7070 RepID=A0A139W901_TRICA|nr:hypothetical protein TcasGA2_TC033284 [Tribolium castaneum]